MIDDNQKTNNTIEQIDLLYKRVWSIFGRASTTLSSSCRQLALGIGSVTLFNWHNSDHSFCSSLTLIFIFLLLFFIFEALQYLYQTLKYQKLGNDIEKKIIQEDDNITEIAIQKRIIDEEVKIGGVSLIFFTLKLFMLLISSVFFIVMLFSYK